MKQGSTPSRSKIFISSSQHPDRLLGQPSLLLHNGYWWLLHWQSSSRGIKLTTHLHLMPRSRMVELYLHFPIYTVAYGIIYLQGQLHLIAITVFVLCQVLHH
jgi:hypothetical protein